jgi:hypothetical protein
MTIDFTALAAEFPRDAVSWRCQTVTKNEPYKGLALAYIDARDVMRRLDAVCGPAGWSDRYEVHGSKTICYLSIRIGDEWITKADGAGDSDVEAEKGAISDAFKRSAVKWGIGRYLYDIPTPWVPCETFNGKWKKWTADPWSCVRQPAAARQEPPRQQSRPTRQEKPKGTPEQIRDLIEHALTNTTTIPQLEEMAAHWEPEFQALPEPMQAEITKVFQVKEKALQVFGEAA